MKLFNLPKTCLRLLFVGVFLCSVIFLVGGGTRNIANAQAPGSRSGAVEEKLPSLLRAIPEFEESVRRATWIDSKDQLIKALGDNPVLETIEFSNAVDGVVVRYPQGTLLLLEFGTPQLSSDADIRFKGIIDKAAVKGNPVYRRIGNYNAFVFNPSNVEEANLLLDKVKYDKVVQWLGEDPKMAERLDRYVASTTAQLLFSTIVTIAIGLGATLALGVTAGLLFFRHRQKQRRRLKTFSDAGGMIRINLDGFSDQPGERNLD